MKYTKNIWLLVLVMLTSMLVSCSDDADESDSPLVGTWTKQVQWAYTEGTRDDSYTFRSNGNGTHKYWNWLDQRYETLNLTWNTNGSTLTIHSLGNDMFAEGTYTYYYSVTSNSLVLMYSDGDTETYYKE